MTADLTESIDNLPVACEAPLEKVWASHAEAIWFDVFHNSVTQYKLP